MSNPRSLHKTCLAIAVLALLSTTACNGPIDPTLAAAYLSADLVAPGGGPARGRVESLLSRLATRMEVGVSALVPNAAYELTADGVAFASFVTDANGAAHLSLSPGALGFDPRERLFAVREPGGADVLVMSDPDATNGGTALAEQSPLAALIGGRGVANFSTTGGAWHFQVAIFDVEPGDYEIWIDGTPRGTIDAASGAGKVDFSSEPDADELLLDFDPRLATIEVRLGDLYIFAGTGHAEILGIDMCVQTSRGRALVAESIGEGVALLTTRADCRRNFRVRISSVPMGDYEVIVGGVVRGTIVVGEDENGATDGELSLTSNAPEEGGLVLDFDPRGEPIEVRQGADLFFSLDAFPL